MHLPELAAALKVDVNVAMLKEAAAYAQRVALVPSAAALMAEQTAAAAVSSKDDAVALAVGVDQVKLPPT